MNKQESHPLPGSADSRGHLTKIFAIKIFSIENLPLFLGVFVRLILLACSANHMGYYGGDTFRYVDLAKALCAGFYPVDAMYPAGYPLFLAPFVAALGSLWCVSLVQIGVFVLFALWVAKTIERLAGRRAAILSVWFLAFDPIWLSQSLIIGADFLGAVFCGIGIFKTLKTISKTPAPGNGYTSRNKNLFFSSTALALAALCKPVYLFLPLFIFPLFRFWRERFLAVAVWLFVIGIYLVPRWATSHTYAFSNHNELLFGRYIVGQILVAKGQPDLYQAMNQSETIYQAERNLEPSLTWKTYIFRNVGHNPILFLRILLGSAMKTVFGNANIQILHFFSENNYEGPNLWVGFSRQEALQEGIFGRLRGAGFFWIFGAFFNLFEKLILFALAVQGSMVLLAKNRKALASFWLLCAYLATSPVVFGEPRYFLAATLVLAYLAAFSPYFQKNNQSRQR